MSTTEELKNHPKPKKIIPWVLFFKTPMKGKSSELATLKSLKCVYTFIINLCTLVQ